MGQAIVYCSNCSAQLRGSDFESRKAFKVDDLSFCAKCCREVLGSEPPPAPAPPAPKLGSTARMSVVHHSAPPEPPPERSGAATGIVAAVGVGIVVIVCIFVFSGGEARRPAPAPSLPSAGPVPAPAPRSSRETAAEESLAKALRTQDLAARRELLIEAVAKSAGTPLNRDARSELERTEWKLQEARAAVAPKVEPPAASVKVEPVPAPVPAPAPAPAPAPVAPDRSREEAARAARWEAALSPATARDYPAALAALEKLGDTAADLALLKAVASLHQEALNALARISKGQKVAIDHRDGTGAVRRAEAAFMESENGLVELRGDAGTLEIEAGEIAPSWLADHLRTRGSAVDPAAAAVFCLLEGDEAGARRLIGDKAVTIPERYWTYARNVAGAPEPARALYQEAVALAAGFATAADAVPKYQALLRDHAENAFVRRNRATIAARLQSCARDFLFVAADLKPSGAFKTGRSAKGNGCWTSESDSDLPKLKENFVELSYSVLPDTAYKCWVYAGGCCQETFEFWVQGTELKAGKDKEPVEPGSGAAVNVKPWLSSLKKTHAMHTGPKQPSTWDWVPISLPKYSKAGVQQIRVLSSQKGFSVAFACVTANRSGPPKELELRELEKSRGVAPAPVVVQGPKGTVLFSLALDGTDQYLVGEYRDRALYGSPLFGQCFAGVERNPAFKMTAQGELRLTYFMKTSTPLSVRFRIPREDKSIMYDVQIVQPVVGRPTEVRLPFAEFKPPYDKTTPPWAPGEPVNMVYIFGVDPNCGLRIDALSMVEFKAEPALPAPQPAAKLAAPPAAKPGAVAPGKIVFSENFDGGPGRFSNGELVDGGIRGSKAISFGAKPIEAWLASVVPAKDSVTVSFKLKPLADVSRIMVLMWSEGLKDNGRYYIDGLKKGEWKEIRFKATDVRIGPTGQGAVIDVLAGFKFVPEGAGPDTRILLDDFEIRE